MQMRHDFAAEARMSSFHHADERWDRLRPTGRRLSMGLSLTVIAGLSALCWAVLIATVMGLQAVL